MSGLTPIERIIEVNGRSRTIRLERVLWEAFDEICLREGVSSGELCAEVFRLAAGADTSDAFALYMATYFRDASRGAVSMPGLALSDALDAIGPILQ